MTIDLSRGKHRQQQAWTTGDYARVGNPLIIVSELLCEAIDLRAGHQVLDVATGTGNAALSAARRHADVTAVDFAPALLDEARRRAEAERVNIRFEVGDAERLPFPDASFDVVLSTAGVMFAASQERAAREMLRICRPGGTIGLANWTPDGFVGHLLRTVGTYAPPADDIHPPTLWGTEDRLRQLFGDGIASMDVTRRSYVFRYRSPRHFVETFRTCYGPLRAAFGALDTASQRALTEDLESLLYHWNTSGDQTLVVPADYLEVIAVRCTAKEVTRATF